MEDRIEKKKKKYIQKYSNKWEQNESFKDWLVKSPRGDKYAYCTVCCMNLVITGGGKSDLFKHMKTQKHLRGSRLMASQKMDGSFNDRDEKSFLPDTETSSAEKCLRIIEKFPEFQIWLEPDRANPNRASCLACDGARVDATLWAVRSHDRGMKHKRNVQTTCAIDNEEQCLNNNDSNVHYYKIIAESDPDSIVVPNTNITVRIGAPVDVATLPPVDVEMAPVGHVLTRSSTGYKGQRLDNHSSIIPELRANSMGALDKFSVMIDVAQFLPNEVNVRIINGEDDDQSPAKTLEVECKHSMKSDEHGFVQRQFIRKIPLPRDICWEALTTRISHGGVLMVEARKKKRQAWTKNDSSRNVKIPIKKE